MHELRLSERSPFDGSCCGGYTGGEDTSDSDSEPTPSPPRIRVVMLGDSATGKTGERFDLRGYVRFRKIEIRFGFAALVNQFMTSEYVSSDMQIIRFVINI